jgi:hypothetical protein
MNGAESQNIFGLDILKAKYMTKMPNATLRQTNVIDFAFFPNRLSMLSTASTDDGLSLWCWDWWSRPCDRDFLFSFLSDSKQLEESSHTPSDSQQHQLRSV